MIWILRVGSLSLWAILPCWLVKCLPISRPIRPDEHSSALIHPRLRQSNCLDIWRRNGPTRRTEIRQKSARRRRTKVGKPWKYICLPLLVIICCLPDQQMVAVLAIGWKASFRERPTSTNSWPRGRIGWINYSASNTNPIMVAFKAFGA